MEVFHEKRELADVKGVREDSAKFRPDFVNWWSMHGLSKALLRLPRLQSIDGLAQHAMHGTRSAHGPVRYRRAGSNGIPSALVSTHTSYSDDRSASDALAQRTS